MAKKNDTPAKGGTSAAPKRNFFRNVIDAYNITRRSFPWVPWAMLTSTIVLVGLNVWYMIWTESWIMGSITIVMLLFLVPMLWVSTLMSKAMLRQIEGMAGAVGALQQLIRRSWIADSQPVAFNKEQDMVWRFLGPKGIILVSEGPHSRVKKLLDDEVKKTTRVAAKVPVHVIESGTEDGQVRLENVMKTMYKYPRALNRTEVPQVRKRLAAITRNEGLPIPKGVDPMNFRANKKMLYR